MNWFKARIKALRTDSLAHMLAKEDRDFMVAELLKLSDDIMMSPAPTEEIVAYFGPAGRFSVLEVRLGDKKQYRGYDSQDSAWRYLCLSIFDVFWAAKKKLESEGVKDTNVLERTKAGLEC